MNTWPKLSSSISPHRNLKLGLRSFSASLLNVRGENNRPLVGEGVAYSGHPQAEKACLQRKRIKEANREVEMGASYFPGQL